MAEGSAIFPEEATIYLLAASAAPSTLATSDAITAEITNFSESGGEEDTESVPVFGGGNIDLVKPRTQIEVSFDVVLRHSSTAATVLKWDSYKWGAVATSTVESSSSAVPKSILIQFTDGTRFYTRAYNNAKGVAFEPEASADDMLRGTMTFKLSPTNANGTSNLKVASVAASTLTW